MSQEISFQASKAVVLLWFISTFFQFLSMSNYSLVKYIFSSSMNCVYRFQFMSHSNHVRDPDMSEVLQAIGVSTSSPKGNNRSPENKQVFLNSSLVSKRLFQLVKGSQLCSPWLTKF